MDPLTLSSISAAVAYFGPKLLEASFDATVGEFTKDSIDWLKSIFFKDDKSTALTKKLSKNPDDKAILDAAERIVKERIDAHPDELRLLQEIQKTLKEKASRGDKRVISILNSKNIVFAKDINTKGGDFIIGDRNA